MVKLTVVPVIPLALSDAMKTARFCHLLERHEPSRVGLAREHLLPLFPCHPRCLGARLEGILDRPCLRHRVRSQTDHANAVRCELGGETPSERLLGGIRWAVAPHQGDARPRVDAVTVMITPDRFAIIRRAARRAVRKYDLVWAVIGRANCSTPSSTSGTPRIPAFGIPTAWNEMSTRPASSITDCRCSSTACSSSASTSAASADPPAETTSLATTSTGARLRPVRNSLAPSRERRATPPPIAPPAP